MDREERQPLLSALEMSTSSLQCSAHARTCTNDSTCSAADVEIGRYGSVTSSADTIRIRNFLSFRRGSAQDAKARKRSRPTLSPSAEEKEADPNHRHHGTMQQTILNIAKACAGTGTLALPYAASQGGLIFNMFGLAVMSCWNIFAVTTLCKCRDLIPAMINENEDEESGGKGRDHNNDKFQTSRSVSSRRKPNGRSDSSTQRQRRTRSNMQKMFKFLQDKAVDIDQAEAVMNNEDQEQMMPPPEGTATYGRVAWYSFGPLGLHMVDAIMVLLLCGIVIAYEDALISFLRATPLTSGSSLFDSLWTVLIIAPLSCVPDLSYLSRCSALGVGAIVATFAVIFWYGVSENGLKGLDLISWSDMWPASFTGICNWYGIVGFGFGVVPICYNIQESMENPHDMPRATKIGLLTVCLGYTTVSNGLAILYKPTVESFQGDVLKELPESWLPTIIRFAMIFVVLFTVPLLVVPCAELLEGKFAFVEDSTKAALAPRLLLRFTICLFCSAMASLIPGFVHIISFIGAFCMSLTSFVLPPLMHLSLLNRKQMLKEANMETSGELFSSSFEVEMLGNEKEGNTRRIIFVDVVFLVFGFFATVAASWLTFTDLLHHAITSK